MPSLGVDCFVMEAPQDVPIEPLIERMTRDARVESVQAVNSFRVLSHDDPLYPLQPTAARGARRDPTFATGKSVRVAAIDSGVELDHPDFAAGSCCPATSSMSASGRRGPWHCGRGHHRRARRQQRGHRRRRPGSASDGAPRVLAGRVGRARRNMQQLHTGESAAVRHRQQCQGDQHEHRRAARSPARAAARGRRDRGIVIVAAADPRAADGGFPASVPGVVAVAADDVHNAPDNDLPRAGWIFRRRFRESDGAW